ncbi:GIY-YIG nuclease family protein [Burkholderia multivorans]
MKKGRTLKLYLVDGSPSGLITAEIMNWSGHVITAPRARLPDLLKRPESQRTGVYFLVGPEQAVPEVYIGETDDVGERLTQHSRPESKGGKDFWEKVCFVTSKDTNLTKGHVKYLESRLIRIARDAGRCQLQNVNKAEYKNLPEADSADMEFFIEQVQTLLPVLSMDFLRTTPDPEASKDAPEFVAEIKKHGLTAQAREVNDEFVVLKGSKARLAWEGAKGGYENLFNELVSADVLQSAPEGAHRVFTRNYPFSSPSAAGAVISGRSTNGREFWTLKASGESYGQWQSKAVEAVTEQTADINN